MVSFSFETHGAFENKYYSVDNGPIHFDDKVYMYTMRFKYRKLTLIFMMKHILIIYKLQQIIAGTSSYQPVQVHLPRFKYMFTD